MNFKDIFKTSFLEGFDNSGFTTSGVIICLLLTTILAVYIFFLYRAITKKTFYSKTFNLSLVAVALIICAIVLTIQSNIVVSLGMVGALSIVRFRTAVKDPLDLTFLFWAIAVGIICGANLPIIAYGLSLLLTVVILLLNIVPIGKAPMLLVININDIKSEKKILSIVESYTKYYKIKSRNISDGIEDMIIELRIKEENNLIDELSEIKSITSLSLLSHDGDATF